MSAWGILAAPFFAQTPAPAASVQEPAPQAIIVAAADDVFGGLSAMDDGAMRDSAGGQAYAVDIAALAINIAENNGEVSNVNTTGNTGQIANNNVQGNGGITTVFNNTGNGVIFQSTVNVNIFMNGGPGL